MPKNEVQGYKKIVASQLPVRQKEELRQLLQRDLTEALVKSIKGNPPDVDLAKIELVLSPGHAISDFNVAADCGTCDTCGTCGTCSTCCTTSMPSGIPAVVIKELGLQPKLIVDKKVIKADNIKRPL